jgi:hypothetical protein
VKELHDPCKKYVDLGNKLNSVENSYETFRNKYELQVTLTTTLSEKDEEVNKPTQGKKDLLAEVKKISFQQPGCLSGCVNPVYKPQLLAFYFPPNCHLWFFNS